MDARTIPRLTAAKLAELDSAAYIHRILHANGWLARPQVDDHGETVTITHHGGSGRRAPGPGAMDARQDLRRPAQSVRHPPRVDHPRPRPGRQGAHAHHQDPRSKSLSVVVLGTAQVRRVPLRRLSPTRPATA